MFLLFILLDLVTIVIMVLMFSFVMLTGKLFIPLGLGMVLMDFLFKACR